MSDDSLTAKQRIVLEFIESRMKWGFPPTLREIAQAIGVRSLNSVKRHLINLEARGYIERDPFAARSIRLKRKPRRMPLPIVGEVNRQGTIAWNASEPTEPPWEKTARSSDNQETN
ncbi:MAG: hypothetical protein N2C14_16530 [Planctomycetales bacterium]